MDFPYKESEMDESLTPGVFAIPGEPAVIINGLPPSSSSVDTSSPLPIVIDPKSPKNAGFGQWFEGREVRKLFGDQYYYGEVTEFDAEVGQFKVKYKNGDVEDLEWKELEKVLQPLDINIPLTTLATEIIKRKQRSLQKQGKSESGTTNDGAKND